MFSLLVFSHMVVSQASCDLELFGQVLDEHNSEPLPFAFIAVEGANKTAISDSLGNYKIEGLCSGKIIIHCDHLGCERIIDTLFLNADQTKHDFRPEHHVNELGILELNITKKDYAIKQTEILNAEEVQMSSSGQLGEAVSAIIGVQNQSTGSNVSKPSIHGMHSNRLLILNNGIRQEGQQWGTDHGVELDFSAVSEVKIVKGANSLAYGSDAIGGVILVNPAPLRKKHGVDGRLNITGESNGRKGVIAGLVNGNFKAIPQLSYRLQGSLKKGGHVHAPDYFIDNTGFEEGNFSWATGYLTSNYGVQVDYSNYQSEFGIFSGAHIGNVTDLNNAFRAKKPNTPDEFTYDIDRPFQRVGHELLKVKSFFEISDSSKVTLVYGRQFNNRSEFDVDSDGDEPDFQFNLTTHTIDVNYKFKNKLTHNFGLQGAYQKNTWSGSFFIPNYEEYTAGAYYIGSFRKRKHHLDYGVRGDFNNLAIFIRADNELQTPVKQFYNLSGSVNYKYDLGSEEHVFTSIGTAWRPPSVNELYSGGLHHGSAALEYGDNKLLKEQVVNVNTGYEFKKDGLKLYAQVYVNYFPNYIYLAPTGETSLTIRGAFPVYEFKQVSANLNGLDFEVSYDLLQSLSTSFKAGIIRANNLTNDRFLWGMPSDEYDLGLSWLPNLKGRFSKTSLSVNYNYVTEQLRHNVVDDFIMPPPAYGILNFKATTQINTKLPLNIYFKINNFLNSSYRSYLNRFRYFTDEIGRNFIVGLSINFEVAETHHHHL